MLAKSKLNSIEALVSQALIDMEISHEEFVMILAEKRKYEKMKENVKNASENQENMRLNKAKFEDLEKITSLQIIYVSLKQKLSEKPSKIIKLLHCQ